MFQAEINKGNKNYQVYNDYLAIMPNAKNNIEKFVKDQNDKPIISPLYEQNNLSIMPYIISSMYTV